MKNLTLVQKGALLLSLAATMAMAAPEKTDLKIGFIPLTDCAALVIAKEKGFFAKHGLNVTLSKEASWANVRDKMTVGELDASHMLAAMPLASTLGVGSSQKNMVALMALGQNGDAITVSNKMYAYMMAHPGKKLLFMGGEFAQYAEWNFHTSLDWHLTDFPLHRGMQKMVSDLNKLYKTQRALHLYDEKREGFEWIDDGDYSHNCLSFIRKSDDENETIVVLCNFADSTRHSYVVGVPYEGEYIEIFNSQSHYYEGWNIGNTGSVIAQPQPCHGREYSISLTLPPLGVVYLKRIIAI